MDDCRVELAAGVALEFGDRVRCGSGGLVAALGGHGVVGVAGGDDPRAEGDGGAGEAVWIAGPVPALVAGAYQPGDGLQGRGGVEDPLADDWVLAYELGFGVGQGSGFV